MIDSHEYFEQWLRLTGEATGEVDVGAWHRPITVIANDAIRRTLDPACVRQAIQARLAPGVEHLVLNPDAHFGHGVPVGCVMVSPTHIYPGPVGVDVKCSMSFLQTDLDQSAVEDHGVRKQLIEAIGRRIPTGAGKGSRHVTKSRVVDERLGTEVATQGATEAVLSQLGIPTDWANRCEDARHLAPNGSDEPLRERLDRVCRGGALTNFGEKISQLGSYGGGNHFGECEVVQVADDPAMQSVARAFGLRDGRVGFLSHCGSRGFGHGLATGQFKELRSWFRKTRTDFPFGDRELVYAEYGSPEADAYLSDMALAANFATVNHLLINALVLEAFQEVIPGVGGDLVYFISHNIVRQEPVDGCLKWVHRKGATRAFPAGHIQLQNTPFAETGHPILLPGNPRDGSSIMVALPGAEKACFSVNHGAGRRMSRTAARKVLTQAEVEQSLARHDVLSNCREYPRDEAPAAYKDFSEVVSSVLAAGLAAEVAKLRASFVIKDRVAADD